MGSEKTIKTRYQRKSEGYSSSVVTQRGYHRVTVSLFVTSSFLPKGRLKGENYRLNLVSEGVGLEREGKGEGGFCSLSSGEVSRETRSEHLKKNERTEEVDSKKTFYAPRKRSLEGAKKDHSKFFTDVQGIRRIGKEIFSVVLYYYSSIFPECRNYE